MKVGERYRYRVRARNEAGLSGPSNAIAVRARSRRLVDNLDDFSQLAAHSEHLALEQRNNRVVLERLSRAVRTSAVAGEHVIYRIDGRPNWFKVFTFFKDDAAGSDFAISSRATAATSGRWRRGSPASARAPASMATGSASSTQAAAGTRAT